MYVHFLATAPWNDGDFVADPRYGGIGKIMIAAAAQHSIENGFKGRIGLHSLPQSEAFYADCAMTDLDRDASEQSLRYYEFTQEQAQDFLNRGHV